MFDCIKLRKRNRYILLLVITNFQLCKAYSYTRLRFFWPQALSDAVTNKVTFKDVQEDGV